MLDKVNRVGFFAVCKLRFGSLKQSQVDNLNRILNLMELDKRINDYRQFAYMLGTFKHETADTYVPVVEYRSDASAERLYGYHTALGQRLGNTSPGDGAAYKGAGLTQNTGKGNALKLETACRWNLTDPPSNFRKVLGDLDNSYTAASYSMAVGLYTGKKLLDYINPRKCDYLQARRIINGMDKAGTVAQYATDFADALKSN